MVEAVDLSERSSAPPSSARGVPSGRPSGRLLRGAVHRDNVPAWSRLLRALEGFDSIARARVLLGLLALGAAFVGTAFADESKRPVITGGALAVSMIFDALVAVSLLRYGRRARAAVVTAPGTGGAAFIFMLASLAGAASLATAPPLSPLTLPEPFASLLAAGHLRALALVLPILGALLSLRCFSHVLRMLEADGGITHLRSARWLLAASAVIIAGTHVLSLRPQIRFEIVLAVAGSAILFAFVALARYLGVLRHVREAVVDSIDAVELDAF